MTTRRKFLAKLGAALVSIPATTVLESCAGGLTTIRGELSDGFISVPRSEADLSLQKHGAMLVRASNLPIPIVLRRIENGDVVALSTVCTHSGCEVRVMPHSFQCPCHGSEYDEQGEVIEGPASSPLQTFEVSVDEQNYNIKVQS